MPDVTCPNCEASVPEDRIVTWPKREHNGVYWYKEGCSKCCPSAVYEANFAIDGTPLPPQKWR
jgi:hypothetical protein